MWLAYCLSCSFFLPLAVILMSSLSQQWNGILPSGFTLNHFVNALHGAAWDALLASLTIGFCASLFALLLRRFGRLWRCVNMG
ncbi:phosphonate ABC transporter permease [Salmonella enterica subsp. enterica]|uniref:Phosphonate ABC transporter permease n=1 Tax=Salmonella enterica I TaxID=59201 RepID=A0A447U8P5_SALET|nr:phosphonate ABC transporter permease [Salmonella enterica subsp. enterica]